MHKVSLPGYTLYLEDGLPPLYGSYCKHASHVDEIDINKFLETICNKSNSKRLYSDP